MRRWRRIPLGLQAPPGSLMRGRATGDTAHIASHVNPPNPPDNGLGFIASLTLLLAIGLPYLIISPFAWIAVWYLGRRQRQQLAPKNWSTMNALPRVVFIIWNQLPLHA